MKRRLIPIPKFISENRSELISWGIFILLFLCVWMFVYSTRIGITPDKAYWNEAGVPILGFQVLFSLIVSLGVSLLSPITHDEKYISERKKRFGAIAIPFVIWALAAGIWLAGPQEQSFNAPRPSPPTYEFYPFSDATSYDIGSQFVLIGQGINNDLLTDKPLYMGFLSLLHALGGQSVRTVISIQVIILALFPVVLYLMGIELHSRGAGILVALLGIFKERNAIAAVLDIQVSHVKLYMTEVPTALLISFVTLLMIRWAKQGISSGGRLPIWVGGIVGAVVLLRPNAYVLLPLVLIIPFLTQKKYWRQALLSASLVLLSFLVIVVPWLITNRDQAGRTYLQVKLENVLERFNQSQSDGTGQNQGVKGTQRLVQSSVSAVSGVPDRFTRFGSNDELSPLDIVAAHFFHNQITAIFTLPMTIELQTLSQTVRSHLWDKNWTGDLTLQNGIMLLINIILLGLGLAYAGKRWKLGGLIPAIIEILYFLSNALARTSGSRYLVPVDWVVYFYYSLGLIRIGEWLLFLLQNHVLLTARPSARPILSGSGLYWVNPVITLFVLGLLMPLSSKVLPQRYPDLNKGQAYKALISEVPSVNSSFTRKQVREFLDDPDSVVFQGRLLYPRYFLANEGLCTRCYILDAASKERPFPRFTFIVLGPFSTGVVIEMNKLPDNFKQLDLSTAPDVWVMGCRNHEEVVGRFQDFHSSVGGLVIAVSGKKGMQVFTPPDAELICED